MLPLESARRSEFSTYFGDSRDLPKRIRLWLEVAGQSDAESLWREFAEWYLHQTTITEAAYAVVPYLASVLDRFAPEDRITYVIQVATVESARVKGPPAPPMPDDLSNDYRSALVRTREAAKVLLAHPFSKPRFARLIAAVCCLHGYDELGDVLFEPHGAVGRCPECRRYVFPENLYLPDYYS